MPTSGSILLNKITLPSQKVVYMLHFKAMTKVVKKIGVKNLIARHYGVALMRLTSYRPYISYTHVSTQQLVWPAFLLSPPRPRPPPPRRYEVFFF